jgi:hypothetical protein
MAARPDPLEAPPVVRLGSVRSGGLSPAILAIVERGVLRRPVPARALRAEVELRLEGGYPPVRILFAEDSVLVEDADVPRPDLRISGALADLVGLLASPSVRGVPMPVNARGRAALGMMMLGRVRVEGRLALVRRVLSVIRV